MLNGYLKQYILQSLKRTKKHISYQLLQVKIIFNKKASLRN